MRFLLLLLLGISSIYYTFSQTTFNRNNQWVFGEANKLNFNNATPSIANVPITMTNSTANASYADINGNLILYAATNPTDSPNLRLYDKNHNPLPNGLLTLSDEASTQGIVITLDPYDCQKLYVIYTSKSNGLVYSKVDLTLNAGNGDVIIAQKDLLIANTASEKLVLCQKDNSKDFWIITREANPTNLGSNLVDQLKSFLVNSTGINMVPVVSTFSNFQGNGTNPNFKGQMALNNKTKLGDVLSNTNQIATYDFNSLTGVFTNKIQIFTGTLSPLDVPLNTHFYGAAFANGIFYTTYINLGTNKDILRYYDLNTNATGAVNNELIMTNSSGATTLKMANNGILYMSHPGTNKLHLIQNPHLFIGQLTSIDGLTLNNLNANGLPNDFAYASISEFNPIDFVTTVNTTCSNSSINLGGIQDSIPYHYHWYNQEFISGNYTPMSQTLVAQPNHAKPNTNVLTNTTKFTLFLITDCGDTLASIQKIITIAPLSPPIVFTPNAKYCLSDNITTINTDKGDLWYTDAALTNQVGTGVNFSPLIQLGVTQYYVIDTTSICTSSASLVSVEFINCPADNCASNELINGDFETFTACPNAPNQINFANNWLGNGNFHNVICNGYYASSSYWPFFTSINYNIGVNGGGIFPPPSGNGYASLILGGTSTKNFIAQQTPLYCNKTYTLQFKATTPRADVAPTNKLCVYGSNVAPPYVGCDPNLTLLGCLPAINSINNHWTPQNITFTPGSNFNYIVMTGQCPTATTNGGTVMIDDLFLCSDCTTNPTVSSLTNTSPDACNVDNGAGLVSASSCANGLSYSWALSSDTATILSTSNNPTNLASGTYQVIVKDAANCATINNLVIAQDTLTLIPNTTQVIQPTCLVTTGSVDITQPLSGTYQYGINNVFQASNSFNNLSPGNYNFNLINPANGCISQSLNITIAPIPPNPIIRTLFFTDPNCITPSGTVQILDPVGVEYTYTMNGITQASSTFNNLTPGATYSLNVTNTLTGCTDDSLGIVIANLPTPPPTPIIQSIEQPTCPNPFGTITLANSAGLTVLLDSVITNNLSNLSPNTYEIYYLDPLTSCTSSSIFATINPPPAPPVISITSSADQIFADQSVSLSASGAFNYIWTMNGQFYSNAGPDISLTLSETTTFCVIGDNLDQCADTICKTIQVEIICKELFIPNAFSPNQNNQDDSFCIYGANCIVEMDLRIFNRWGELVFQSKDPDKCWDGTFRGSLVEGGIYSYTFIAEDNKGAKIKKSGFIQVKL